MISWPNWSAFTLFTYTTGGGLALLPPFGTNPSPTFIGEPSKPIPSFGQPAWAMLYGPQANGTASPFRIDCRQLPYVRGGCATGVVGVRLSWKPENGGTHCAVTATTPSVGYVGSGVGLGSPPPLPEPPPVPFPLLPVLSTCRICAGESLEVTVVRPLAQAPKSKHTPPISKK